VEGESETIGFFDRTWRGTSLASDVLIGLYV